MTEILVEGETVYIDDEKVTGTNAATVHLVQTCYTLERIPNYGAEYTIAMCAVNTLGAKIISGDALTTLAPNPKAKY